MTTKELATYNPNNMIEAAIAKGADLVQLEKLLELQERFEANEARKAYYDAMAKFKANPPSIDKDQTVSYSQTSYRHASLANVTSKISKALSEHGLSATWKTAQDDKNISVTCTISHRQGYSESTTLSAAPDDSGKKNSIQAIGSTITYLERYTILAMTGLATHEADDDGAGSEVVHITEDQVNELHAMIKENGLDKDKKYVPRMLKFLKVESLDLLPANDFKKAKTAFEAGIKAQGESK